MIWRSDTKIYVKVNKFNMYQDAYLRHNGKWSEMRQCWIFDAAQYTMEDLAQVLNVPIIPTLKPRSSKPRTSEPQSTSQSAEKMAAKLESLATTAEKNAKNKRSSSIFNQRPTARRMSIGASIAADAYKLEQFALACRALAQGHRTNQLPDCLKTLSKKSDIESCLQDWNNSAAKDALIKLLQQFQGASSQLQRDATDELVRQKVREIWGCQIEGFFPSPRPVVEKLLDVADIEAHHKVLEPSAGIGSIADVIIERFPHIDLTLCELNYRLCEILLLKRFNVLREDFLRIPPQPIYNRVVMNPPFTIRKNAGAYIDHILHAFQFLQTGGTLTAVAPPSFLYRREEKFRTFLSFVESKGSYEPLPDGSFKNSFHSTEVKTLLVKVVK
jgi:hypothetical protein